MTFLPLHLEVVLSVFITVELRILFSICFNILAELSFNVLTKFTIEAGAKLMTLCVMLLINSATLLKAKLQFTFKNDATVFNSLPYCTSVLRVFGTTKLPCSSA